MACGISEITCTEVTNTSSIGVKYGQVGQSWEFDFKGVKLLNHPILYNSLFSHLSICLTPFELPEIIKV